MKHFTLFIITGLFSTAYIYSVLCEIIAEQIIDSVNASQQTFSLTLFIIGIRVAFIPSVIKHVANINNSDYIR